MKANYDFSKGRRGPVLPQSENKERITIRLDRDILTWFRARVEKQGGGSYQTMINDALRAYMTNHDGVLEDLLRRVIREEIKHTS